MTALRGTIPLVPAMAVGVSANWKMALPVGWEVAVLVDGVRLLCRDARKLTSLDGGVVAQGGIVLGATFTAIQEQGLPAGLHWMELQGEDHIGYLRVSISK